MTAKLYLLESQCGNLSARITDIQRGDVNIVRLDQTIFHPQGGGQKADRGRIGPASVVHVVHSAGSVDHYVDSCAELQVGDEVPLELDWSWRSLNSTYHTAGHLLASVVEQIYPNLRAVSGHQWPGEGRVEFLRASADANFSLDNVNDQLRSCLAADLAVCVVGDPFSDRAIRIGEFPPIPCGGTHVTRLSQILNVSAKAPKIKGDRVRVGYSLLPPGSD